MDPIVRWTKIITKKINKVKDDPSLEIVQADPDSLSTLLIAFRPNGGHYKDQIHILSVNLTNGNVGDWFPSKPPKVHFLTKIFHTNVSPQSGWICLDILQDRWSPMNSFDTLVQTIILLLDDPSPTGNHLNAAAARLQQSCQREFDTLSKKLNICYGDKYDKLYKECFKKLDAACQEVHKNNETILKKYACKFSKFM